MTFCRISKPLFVALLLMVAARPLVAQQEPPRFVLNTGGPVSPVQSLAFSPDSTRLYAGGFDKVVYAWELIQQRRRLNAPLVQTLRWQIARGQRGVIYSVAASPADRTLAIGGVSARNGNGDIILYDTARAAVLTAFQCKDPTRDGHAHPITALAWSPDGKTLASTSIDAEVRIWSAATRQPRMLRQGVLVPGSNLELKQDSVWPIAFLSDTVLAAAAPIAPGNPDGQIALYDLANPAAAPVTLPAVHPKGVTAIARDPATGRWASASRGGPVYLWQGVDAAQPQALSISYPAAALAFAGPTLFIATLPTAAGATLQQWDTATANLLDIAEISRLTENVGCLAISPDLQWLATCGGDDSPVIVFPLKDRRGAVLDKPLSGRPPLRLRGRSTDIGVVAFANDGSGRLGFGPISRPGHFNDYGDIVQAFDFEKGLLIRDGLQKVTWRPAGAAGWSIAVDKQHRGRYHLMFGGRSQATITLNPDRQGELSSYCWLAQPSQPPWGIALGTTHQNGVFIYQRLAGQECRLLRYFRDHTGWVTSLSQSLDGKYLASGAADQTIKIWSLEGIGAPSTPFPRASAWGAVFELTQGRLVAKAVVPNGIAGRRGLRANDRVVSVLHAAAGGEITHTDPPAMLRALAERDVWESIIMQVERQGQVILLPTIVPAWEPLMTLFVDSNGEWALSTPQGPYDASIDGDELFGWLINDGVDKTPKFFLAEQFRQEYERPGELRKLFTVGAIQPPGTPLGDALAAAPILTLDQPLDGEEFKAGSEIPIIATIKNTLGRAAQNFAVRAWLNGIPYDGTTVRTPSGEIKVTFNVRPVDVTNALVLKVAPRDGRSPGFVLQRRDFRAVGEFPEKPRLHMVALAAGNYALKDQQLEFAVPDAKALIERLQAGAANLYEPGEIFPLYENNASPHAWSKLVSDLRGKVNKRDLVIVYIAGHGEIVDSKFYFVPALPNLNLKDRPGIKQYGISWELVQQIRELSCRKVVLIDTCNSGNTITLEEAKQIVRPLKSEQMLVVTAAGVDQEALAFKDDQHSAFNKSLLDALSGEADRQADGEVDLPEAISFVLAAVPKRAAQFGGQNPMLFPKDLLDSFPLPLVQYQRAPQASSQMQSKPALNVPRGDLNAVAQPGKSE